MDIRAFGPRKPGKIVEVSGLPGITHAFIPDPLPPNWQWPPHLLELLVNARVALATLDGVGRHLPSPELLLRPIQMREALRSSSLEGTYSSAEQLLLFQIAPEASRESEATDAAREVDNYSRALNYYFSGATTLPISLRLIKHLHEMLMKDVRGKDRQPGVFRRTQDQIGLPARFIPPPPNEITTCLNDLEQYLYTKKPAYDPLVNAFIVHYQFETIHPFLDGNGRVGRLLLSILIKEWCGLSNQWLFMSPYFEANKTQYIDCLFQVSARADWEGWIRFCLEGTIAQANDTISRCDRLLTLSKDFTKRIQAIKGKDRLRTIADWLFVTPMLQVPYVRRRLNITYASAKAELKKLVGLGILKELAGAGTLTYYAPDILKITSD
jgi:cell filamentation protein, protein adenylyltransferase